MAEALKYFIYARKSTDAEDRQVRSIDAQLSELHGIARREGLEVVDELVEKRTAKQPGRPIFNAMLDRIEAGEASGILAWHADRLARNSVDGGRVIYLLDTRKVRMLRFYGGTVENTPQGKMMLNAEFGFSKYYVDSLSENVKRGHRDKVQRGECPATAPIGYLNDARVKRIAVDRERAPLVRQAFEMYAGGDVTIDTIRRHLGRNGVLTRTTVRSPGGKLVCRSVISNMLANPLYYGHFKWGGEVHVGRHEPIISKELFDRVQAVLWRRLRYSLRCSTRRPAKAFAGLLRCGECGRAVTAEVQKGHTYYRCTKKNTVCSQRYVREEALDLELTRLLSRFRVPAGWADRMRARLAEERASSEASAVELTRSKRAEIDRLTGRLTRMKELLLEGLMSPEEARADRAKMLSRRRTLEEQATTLATNASAWLEPFEEWVSTAQALGQTALTGSLTQKKALAEKVFGSNLVLEDKKARGEAVKPWSLLAENPLSHDAVHLFDVARTFFMENHVGRECGRIEPDARIPRCAGWN